VTADIDDFTGAAAYAVKNGGTVVVIYPAEQFTILSEALSRVRLEIKQLRFVYSYPGVDGEARLVLVKCQKNGGKGVKVLAPLYIYDRKNGDYSPEMQELYKP
jgi:tRNA1Val (adenine37-N6)-methyltransferase